MSDENEKFKAETFTLFANKKTRADEIHNAGVFIDALPIDQVFRLKVLKGEEGRKEVANRCYQLVMGQMIKQKKERADDINETDPAVIAGKLKYVILLPLKPIMAAEYGDDALMSEYELERELCDMINASDKIQGYDVFRAYDRAIRSKTLNVKPFARYLNTVIERVTIQGFVIKLKPSDRDRALGEQLENAA